jgi:hypothetical protein
MDCETGEFVISLDLSSLTSDVVDTAVDKGTGELPNIILLATLKQNDTIVY